MVLENLNRSMTMPRPRQVTASDRSKAILILFCGGRGDFCDIFYGQGAQVELRLLVNAHLGPRRRRIHGHDHGVGPEPGRSFPGLQLEAFQLLFGASRADPLAVDDGYGSPRDAGFAARREHFDFAPVAGREPGAHLYHVQFSRGGRAGSQRQEGREEKCRSHQGWSTPRSRQILRTVKSAISVCLVTGTSLLVTGFWKTEYFPPSRESTQPLLTRCLTRSFLFIVCLGYILAFCGAARRSGH